MNSIKSIYKFRLYLFLLFIIGTSTICFGDNQNFYICTENQLLLKVDIQSCTTTFIGMLDSVLTDIAITPDNKLYGLGRYYLYSIDTQNADLDTIGMLDLLSVNSLVSDIAGNLLTVSIDSVFQIDKSTGHFTSLGYYGPFPSAGDLTFYNDTLYLSTNNNELVKIILHPTVYSAVIDTMPVNNIYGINTICLNSVPTMIASSDVSLYSINPSTAAVTLLCNNLTNDNIYGATSKGDFLNAINSCSTTGISSAPEFSGIEIFPNPTSTFLNIQMDSYEENEIILSDITSKQLLSKKFNHSISIDINSFVNGFYFYQLQNNNGFVKQGRWLKVN